MPDGTRVPAFAPGRRAHAVAADEVLVLGDDRTVTLHGRPHALVAPLIDGRRSEAELVAALAGRLSAPLVQLSLLRMTSQGVVVSVPRGAVAPPVAPAPAASLGVDPALAARIEEAVAARGAAPAGLTIVDDLLREELDALAARCFDAGGALLPLSVGGPRWLLGPRCEDAATWQLLRTRLRRNRRGDVEALRRGATFPLREPLPLGGELLERAVARIAALVAAPPPALVGGLLAFDPRSGVETEHRLARVVGVGSHAVDAAGAAGADASADAMRARLEPLVSPLTGIVGALERVPSLPGTHVYASAGTLDWPADGGRPQFRGGVLGKGLSDAQARVSCIGEAIELLSATTDGDEPRRSARWAELAADAVHPRELLLISEAQYAQAARDALAPGDALASGDAPAPGDDPAPRDAPAPGDAPASGDGPAWDPVPAPFDERHAIDWVPFRSFVDGATRWVPAACCWFEHVDRDYPASPFATADANGCAAGATVEQAIVQGLLELIERDATALWWYSRARRPALALDLGAEPSLAAIRDALAARGQTLTLLDLRADTSVPVVAAVATDSETGAVLPIGRGCHPDARVATRRALAELAQVTAIDGPPGTPPTLAEHPYLAPLAAASRAAGPARDATAVPAVAAPPAAATLTTLVQTLAGLGLDVLVLETTRAEIGLPAVRVVVPGLRPLRRRLAPGRLYDVPAALGWVPRRLREQELNDTPFLT
ncbi:MAG TPA: YcaO-like family protein [Conexibacter sp.]|nr:YcaO-like family protein [Conexibacter sp.]